MKDVTFGSEARDKMFVGIEKLAKAVGSTMGPKGRNVVLEKPYGTPVITNDGVTIARDIFFKDKLENMGAQLVKEAATKTNDVAGDGTSSSCVLAYAIIKEGLKNLAAGANPVGMKNGIDKAIKSVVEELAANTKQITTKEEVEQVATLSAQSEEVGKIIAEIMDTVGRDGVITVEEGQAFGLTKKVVEGMQFENGYISAYMITDTTRMEASYEDPYILVTDKNLTNIQELMPILKKILDSGKKEVLIICDNMDGDVLSTVTANKLRGVLNVVAVRAPAFGERKKEMFKDICAVTGATLIAAENGTKLETATLADLGGAKKIIVDKDNTTIVEGTGRKEDIEMRKEIIKSQLSMNQSDYDIQKLHERLAKLSGGVGVIMVGAATEVELQEKKHRIEDALSATRAAVDEGIVVGGGTALLRSIKCLDKVTGKNHDEEVGIDIVRNALSYPIKKIAENAGKQGDVIAEKVLEREEYNIGYNAATDQYEDLFEAGIIDPKKVTRSALQHAASVASMFLTTEAAVSEVPTEEDKKLPPMF